MSGKVNMKIKIALEFSRNLDVSSEIHYKATILAPGQEEIIVTEILANEDHLACFLAELEDNICAISGVESCSLSKTGFDQWEWEMKTPRE